MKYLITLSFLLTALTWAESRSSENFAMTSESFSAGGTRSSSVNFEVQSSVDDFALSTTTSSNFTGKSGTQGQQYSLVALQINGTPLPLTEGFTLQLSAAAVADDDTLVNIAAAEVDWSVKSGPIESIDSSGLATAGNVYADTPAEIEGDYLNLTGQLNLSVLNSGSDDFGLYAGDGLDDAWQFTYFGEDNPNAGPAEDPDGDSQDNTSENLTGFIPTDSNSRLTLSINSLSGSTVNFTVNKAIPGNDYTLKYKKDLGDALEQWKTITTLTPATEVIDTPLSDSGAGDPSRVYRLEVSPLAP